MCAINPKHKKRFILDVYTSNPTMTKVEFDNFVIEQVLDIEMILNSTGKFRWHVRETEQEAD